MYSHICRDFVSCVGDCALKFPKHPNHGTVVFDVNFNRNSQSAGIQTDFFSPIKRIDDF